MEYLDLNLPDPDDWKTPEMKEIDKQINRVSDGLGAAVLKAKEAALLEAIEIVDGKVPRQDEVKQFGEIRIVEGQPSVEYVFWRGKPLIKLTSEWKDGKFTLIKEWGFKLQGE